MFASAIANLVVYESFLPRILSPAFTQNFEMSLFDLGRSLLFSIVSISIFSAGIFPDNIPAKKKEEILLIVTY